MNKVILYLTALLFPCFTYSFSFQDFDSYQGKVSKQEIKNKLKYLIKTKEAQNYFLLNDDTFTIYASLEKKQKNQEEYRLVLGLSDVLQTLKKRLNNCKIAIDPGHFGSEYSHLEQRFVEISSQKELIAFNEGDLTFLTALYLKELLEKEGAEVFLTRARKAEGALSQNFFQFLQTHPDLWLTQKTLTQLFRSIYNGVDLYARAEKINAFKPDLTVIIHYNAHDSKGEKHTSTTDKNFNMVFIPGSFGDGELKEKKARYEFLRLLVTSDFSLSRQFSKIVLKKFNEHLQIPTVTPSDGAHYLETASIEVEKGVYARNLALTRLVHGPLCYGESLVQNNLEEALRLSRLDTEIQGYPCSSRLKEVALAYFQAIQEFLCSEI
ncbi:N-acetylmuramoyl-L-alanine amidase family protein [Candidatus Rhabdochlamydia porcellionis]|jgi:N-acetylmuramoyl-L-alanine amidase|uniref:N-acetylmuramoyl-L-alanine amidase n=1 Tax=Candidatus Rhabdochlamydia porcellionis TaxID=225148 RepID=A0ABX8Z465_9BACT|nr:N-acetylmuramoyl-L-alanine amidase [Candidatus Rhabdochlamydia porcellionis]QZA59103.1 N-acetylmuramoyl-L-alanine amidase [Candidatus Rhabdochlamydia porcellionis]